ncbi:MAG TPA: 50S ribosomal protein L25 [Kosmotogaceae bacterium]|nr:MAG: 50S ribosomal protein L25 [Thermotogales bacterium 46_20]HAA85545.1 50S ribosomal protein L25 [Kosmotogaceae bacterium]
MQQISFETELRDLRTKAKHLLEQGKIPAIVYGPAIEPLPVTLDRSEIMKVVNTLGGTSMVNLNLEDGKAKRQIKGFVKSVQRHRVTDAIVHIDFYVPESGHVMDVEVPINLVGKPVGVEQGGVLEKIITYLPVSVLPQDIVERIDVNIEHLEIGDVLRVSDLEIPGSMKIHVDSDQVIAVVEAPRAITAEEEVEEAEGEEEGVEPEVIEKGKKEEAEEE